MTEAALTEPPSAPDERSPRRGVGRDDGRLRSADSEPPPESPAHRSLHDVTCLLFGESSRMEDAGDEEDRSFAPDLNLDQIVRSIAGDREEHDLITTLLYRHVDDVDTVHYRQEVFRDLEDRAVFARIQNFADRMRQVRDHLVQVKKMQYQYQREGWFLDAASI